MPQPSIDATTNSSSSTASSDRGLTLSDILRMLRKHVMFILACMLICVAASVIYLIIQKPIYEATALLRIDPARASSLGVSNGLGGGDAGSLVNTEIAVLTGDGVARRTLASLPPGTQLSFVHSPSDLPTTSQTAESLTPQQQQAIDTLQSNAYAKQVEGTQLISVAYRDVNPTVAATVVNTLVQAYSIETFQDRANSVAQLRTWLSNEMASLRNQVEASQKKLAAFQEANNIIGTNGNNTTVSDRLRLLNDSLAAAQANRITKEAALRAARTGDPNTLAALYPNPHLESLQREQATQQAKANQLAAKFGTNYPPLLEANKELRQVNSELAADMSSVQQRLQQEYDAALATQNMLKNEYDKQTQLAYSLNRNEAEYAVLQAEVTSSKDLYDTLRRQLEQAGVNAEVTGLNTILVDNARIPTDPVLPKKWLILGASVLLGLFAGVAAAFVRESNSDHLISAAQVHDAVGYPTLAVINHDRSSAQPSGLGTSSLVTLQSPSSPASESFRALRNTLLLFPQPAKTVLMTSPGVEERVDTFAANVAVVLAQAGFRVLLVDANFLDPTLHNQFGVSNEMGLSEYLVGTAGLASYAHAVPEVKDLYLMTAGQPPATTSDAALWRRIQPSLKQWETEFDYTILTSAPVALASNTLLLATWVGGVVIVARYNATMVRALGRLRDALHKTTAVILGVAVDDVPASLKDASF